MVPPDRAMTISYTLSIVTMSLNEMLPPAAVIHVRRITVLYLVLILAFDITTSP